MRIAASSSKIATAGHYVHPTLTNKQTYSNLVWVDESRVVSHLLLLVVVVVVVVVVVIIGDYLLPSLIFVTANDKESWSSNFFWAATSGSLLSPSIVHAVNSSTGYCTIKHQWDLSGSICMDVGMTLTTR